MAGNSRWAYYNPQVTATIGGVQTDVVKVQASFGLNMIPTCQVWLPVGRSTKTGAPAAAHAIAQAAAAGPLPITVTANLVAGSSSDSAIRGLGIPSGAFTLFDGVTAGPGYARAGNAVQYTIAANHWLVGLTQGSALSEASNPGNPSRYAYGALMRGSQDTGSRYFTTLQKAQDFVTPGNITRDFWKSAVLPWFTDLAKQDGIWNALGAERNLRGSPNNSQALPALRRMAGGACALPLKPRSTITVDADLATEIAKDVALLTHDVGFAAHQTFWDILVGNFASSYSFAVVPRALDAAVVPYVPAYRGPGGNPWAVLQAGEYSTLELQGSTPRPLRAFGLLAGLGTRSGANGFDDDNPPDGMLGCGGFYDAARPGSVIIRPAPRWASAMISPGNYAAAAAGGAGAAVGNAHFPGAGAANGARARGKARAAGPLRSILDAMAQARFAEAVLAGRQGYASGALRLDIAPGSVVGIEGIGEGFIAGDGLGQDWFGTALQVTVQLDAEGQSCGTAFTLGAMRSAAENASDNATVGAHPLWANTFAGCNLVDS